MIARAGSIHLPSGTVRPSIQVSVRPVRRQHTSRKVKMNLKWAPVKSDPSMEERSVISKCASTYGQRSPFSCRLLLSLPALYVLPLLSCGLLVSSYRLIAVCLLPRCFILPVSRMSSGHKDRHLRYTSSSQRREAQEKSMFNVHANGHLDI